MRVLVVGDTHGDWGWVRDEVIPTAVNEQCPRIVQLGDFGFVHSGNVRSVRARLNQMSVTLADFDRDLTFVPGNHEHHPMLTHLAEINPVGPEGHAEIAPRVHYTGRVSAWEWAGVRCAAVGGAVSIDRDIRTPGVDWFPEEELSPEEEMLAKGLDPVTVLFSHEAPRTHPFRFLVPDSRSERSRQRMTEIADRLQPQYWFHGHYHAWARYHFQPRGGQLCTVVALDCNGHPDSMIVVDLAELA